MNNSATLTGGLADHLGAKATFAVRRIVLICSLVVLGTVGLSQWFCWQGKRMLHDGARGLQPEDGSLSLAVRAGAELRNRIDDSMLRVSGAAAAVGVGCLASLLITTLVWRRRLAWCLEEQSKEWKVEAATMLNQLAEARRVKEQSQLAQSELEEQVKRLGTAKAALEEDLDRRTRVERTFAQKRQELESSKSVLELHVQARTLELQKLQRRYEMILNSAGEGICGLDAEGRATFVNPTVAKLTGLPIDELVGKTEQEIFPRNGANGSKAAGDGNSGEEIFHRKDGTFFPVEFVRTPINENNRVVGTVLVFKDITERKRAEETLSQKAAELARSNAELEQFAFVASHDLQEPLRKIQAFGDRLRSKCEGVLPEEARDYLERMQSASARMRTLINDLLAFSRVIRSGEPFVPVDLSVVVKEVLSDLEVRIEKTGARIEVGALPTVEADPMQMRQLFQNLASNALKFQPPGGVPTIKIQPRVVTSTSGAQYCEISVQDNGIGFDEKYVDRIFAVFQRLHGRTEYEGTGVGLAVCRRIVDRHSGTIIARSRPGEGATFLVTLPLVQSQPKGAA